MDHDPMNIDTGGVRMKELGPELGFLHDLKENPENEIGGICFIDPVKGLAENVIVDIFRKDPGTEKTLCRKVAEEFWKLSSYTSLPNSLVSMWGIVPLSLRLGVDSTQSPSFLKRTIDI